jgi:hypothetical protein
LAGELAASLGATTEEVAISNAFDRYENRMRAYVEQGQELPPGGADGYAPKSKFRIALGWASMRWSQRWPLRALMERVFSKADAINLPDYAALSVAQQNSARGLVNATSLNSAQVRA